jgi:hypothetical protein
MADSDSNTPATKGDLIALEQRLKEATKADLIALEERLKAESISLEERLNGESIALEGRIKEATKAELIALEERLHQKIDDLIENFRDMQTEMLKAFYSFAETNQARLTATERETAALKERMSMMESRLIQVEKRLNMPLPPAA